MMMVLVVTGISTLIHIFSIGYMAEDPALLALLCLSQPVHLFHVVAGHGRQLRHHVLWLGGVGLCSYLLIAFWYTDPRKQQRA